MDSSNALSRARAQHQSACEARDAAYAAIEALPDNAHDAEADAAIRSFDTAQSEVERTKTNLERLQSVHEARANTPAVTMPGSAVVRGALRSESTYRPDSEVSFFRDLVLGRNDPAAQERLLTHSREMHEVYRDRRDVTSGGGGAGVIPPLYMGELYAEMPRASRPFADAVPTRPLPSAGMTISVPRVTTATTMGVQAAELTALSKTDIGTSTLSVPVVTIGGINDLSLQALERSEPGLDMLVFEDLQAAYDALLDTQLLSGTGASGQHLGIRAVSAINTSTYTDASPTAAKALPKIYDAIQLIGSTRYRNADTIVMHPRRAAWFGSNLSTSFPLFQQGQLNQAAGQQSGGFLTSFAGLKVVLDPNIGTTYGGGTNEDEIYVVHSPDLILLEGVPRAEVFRDSLSASGTVRLRLYSYTAFVSGRQPKSIAKVSGTGLAAPTW